MHKTFIIAEAGANHDRNFDQALKLIDVAVHAGSDAVKFQTYSSKTLYSKYTPDFAGYQNIPNLIKEIELPRAWQKDLKQYCDESGIEFMSTPFDEKAVDELCELGIDRFKIASFEARDPRLIKYIARTNKPIIISAGVGVRLELITEILEWIIEENPNPDVTFLHCNSAYPTPFEDSCLLQIQKLKDTTFQIPVNIGLSDHTTGILVPPLAVVLGAKVIEKHFTLDRSLSGPDHPFAIEPDELKQMVINIRTAEKCMQIKPDITESEKGFINAMRSVVLKRDVKRGELITEDNITTKRPAIEGCVPSWEYFELIKNSYRLKADLTEDTILMWGDIDAQG